MRRGASGGLKVNNVVNSGKLIENWKWCFLCKQSTRVTWVIWIILMMSVLLFWTLNV